ncbi:leucyl aminopeptidase family protein [Labilibaculum antarcticum]|uniref:Probable cytosol aminopeptidase n=1 Tax=Labilibaculum antarcticum TaxID=1717717 RepID=A0A1Y1CJY2_9BACT|nr:leucyl aminopeptidase [Labilibaculum antarcticum]BAX80383.1 peptidase M17 [Labilibaculum antarcticum]
MKIEIKCFQKPDQNENILYLATTDNYKNLPLSDLEMKFAEDQIDAEVTLIELNRYTHKIYLHVSSNKVYSNSDLEKMRQLGFSLHTKIQESKISKIILQDYLNHSEAILAFVEGVSLTNYQFLKYFTDTKKTKHTLDNLTIHSDVVSEKQLNELEAVVEGVKFARELVNEPLSYLTAQKLSEEIQKMGVQAGFSVDVFGKRKIESLKMGGLLAVNKGSIDEPTFSILEWKSEDAVNVQPIIFVGKGVVYDTGGLSLKPTKDSMDLMKSDMGGAASVAGAIYAIAKAKLPIHVIGLIPATDNRPGGNAYVPGDVVEMYNGKTVEVLNTDAEGRMLLADALSYADKYKPEFVVDLATLTGAAAAAIGKYGVVAMGNKESNKKMIQLKESGEKVYERLVEFPFWEEFDELIKSDIADLKNIGGRDGGAITAGKFLEHFTNYPWVHLDIAGPAFVSPMDNYRGKGGTGVGVRLLFEFIKQYRS